MAKRKKKTKKAISPKPMWLQISPWHGLLFFLLGAALYLNTLGHEYTQDDAIVIYDNEFVTQGLSGIPELYRYDTFRGFFKVEGKDKLVSGGRYRPLTPTMFALEWALFGHAPLIGHLLNILLYGLCCLLAYFVIRQLLESEHKAPLAVFVAFVATLLFTTHPLHTEAVANIKGRDEIMSLLFGLLAIGAALRALKAEQIGYAALAGLCVFLGLLSKETAVAFVVLVPLALWYFASSRLGKIIKASWPVWLGFAVYMAIRISVLGTPAPGEEPPRELMNNPFLKLDGGYWVDFSFSEWSATVMYSLGKYLQLFIWPHPLTHDYYPRHIDIMQWSNWQVWLSALAYVSMLGYALWGLIKKDIASYGIWLYLICLFPVSNLLFPVGTNLSERFLFAPSLGLVFTLAVWLYRLCKNKLQMAAIGLVLVACLLSVKTIMRNTVWKDNFTLFTTDVVISKNSAKLRNSAGGVLLDHAQKLPQGDALRQQEIEQAKTHLKEAIRIHPSYNNAYLLLGNAHVYAQEYDEAVAVFKKALSFSPNYELAKNNLFIAYRSGGKYFGEQKNDIQKALTYLKAAEQMRPDDIELIRLLGVAYGVSQNTPEAIRYFRRSTELQPDNALAWWNLGIALANSGDVETGNAYMQKAREIDPKVGQAQ